jgi:hypothetical protein
MTPPGSGPAQAFLPLADYPPGVDDGDRELFAAVTSTALSPEQEARILAPAQVYPEARSVLAVHWHPEFVPLDLIRARIEATFPNKVEELIIPTQHNELLSYGPWTGAEVDCYASGFDQKVQLLVHFENSRVAEASVLRSMLAHTATYRASQLHEFLRAVTKPDSLVLERAVRECGADEELIGFARTVAAKISALLAERRDALPGGAIKNKLVRDFLDGLRPRLGDTAVNRAQALFKSVKEGVKAAFSLKHFYRATEVIEEVRGLGGGVVIPHPEQFWPILLGGYDVDGVEVWNPESQRYTDFLIRIISEKNREKPRARRLLVFMGDDCHMGEKAKHPSVQNPAKASRQIGVQPGWTNLAVRKMLMKADMAKETVIAEYKARLNP